MIELPTPEELLAKAKAMPVKSRPQQQELLPFMPAVEALRAKGYSFAFIARFLNERLGAQFGMSAVYSCFRQWEHRAILASLRKKREAAR